MAAYDSVATQFGVDPWILILAFVIALAWKFFWYGLALYKAIEKKHKTWFVVLVIGGGLAYFFNDLGILAIIYLILHKDKKGKKKI